jgi:Cys-tRNA(Pro) deacylase
MPEQRAPRAEPVQHVQDALDGLGIDTRVIEFDVSTRTAEDAAAAVGCEPGQIVKSLFFLADGRPTLALVAGDRQADTARLAALLGVGRKKLRMGAPDEVREATGYEVGGVSPVGLRERCDVVVDESLRRFSTTWAAAGAGNAVFAIPPERLVEITAGQWAAITKDSE